jgi:hypothetical protein
MRTDDGGLPARRRDDESEWHDLLAASCPHCGCEYFVAKDDPEIVWEPGQAWDTSCPDHGCHCHVSPVVGRRRIGG